MMEEKRALVPWKRVTDSRGRGLSTQTEAAEEIDGGSSPREVSPFGKIVEIADS